MAAVPAFEAPVTPAEVIEVSFAALDALEAELWAARRPEELLAANVGFERVRSRVAALQARVAVEIEASDAQKSEGWASAANYLTDTSGARRGHGNRLLRTSRELCGDLAVTLDALP
jgi:hypothetical protein